MITSPNKVQITIMHYDNGDMVNIQDLPKAEYVKFLEQMNALRMAYIALVSRP